MPKLVRCVLLVLIAMLLGSSFDALWAGLVDSEKDLGLSNYLMGLIIGTYYPLFEVKD